MNLIKHTLCDRCIHEVMACMYWLNGRSPTTDQMLSDDVKKMINIMKKDMLAYDA